MRKFPLRLKQIFAAVITVVLLLPLPAVADFTFNGGISNNWTLTSGIPGWTWSDVAGTNFDQLTINPASGTGPATFTLNGTITTFDGSTPGNGQTLEGQLLGGSIMTVSGPTTPNLTLQVQVSGASPSPGFLFSPSHTNNQFNNGPVAPTFSEQTLTLDQGSSHTYAVTVSFVFSKNTQFTVQPSSTPFQLTFVP
jgi:hypothetical protein